MNTYHVRPWGDDVNGAGTQDAPWRSFYKAFHTAGPGDAVIVTGGRDEATHMCHTLSIEFDAKSRRICVVVDGWFAYEGWDLSKATEIYSRWLDAINEQAAAT